MVDVVGVPVVRVTVVLVIVVVIVVVDVDVWVVVGFEPGIVNFTSRTTVSAPLKYWLKLPPSEIFT